MKYKERTTAITPPMKIGSQYIGNFWLINPSVIVVGTSNKRPETLSNELTADLEVLSKDR